MFWWRNISNKNRKTVWAPKYLPVSLRTLRATLYIPLLCLTTMYLATLCWNWPKQPSRGVLRKRGSENMQQIYRRTPMPIWTEIAIRHGCSPINLLHILRTRFRKNTSKGILLNGNGLVGNNLSSILRTRILNSWMSSSLKFVHLYLFVNFHIFTMQFIFILH